MAKDIKFNIEARSGLKRGVDALANAVKVTFGQKGRNVIIDKGNGELQVTKDGVTVAEAIDLEDPLENLGAQMVKEVASKTNVLAGDGTTTATILAQAIVAEGLKNIAAGANPIDLKRGIDKAVKVIVEELNKSSQNVDGKVEQIANISANNDETIGALISEAFNKVGKNGVITLEEGKGMETYTDVVEGMKFDRGYLSNFFVTNDKAEVDFEDPFILITEDKISTVTEIFSIIEKTNKENRPLLIIADDIKEEVLTVLAVNKIRFGLKVAAIKAPGYGDNRKEMLEDIAILTGGTVISEEKGMSLTSVDINMLGVCKRIVTDKESTLIVGGYGEVDLIKQRTEDIKSKIPLFSNNEKDVLELRLARLAGGVAVLYVGAASEIEMREKKDRVQDALSATKAAVEEGIVAGGGVALLRARLGLSVIKTYSADEASGVNIIYQAVELPLRTMMANAGLEGAVIMSKILENDSLTFGYDTKTDTYVDMIEAGIIDPKKVTRVALENAASVAGMILLTECALIEIKENLIPEAPQMPSKGFL